jgi:diguanylate cyclase (GGDEF)-like protein
MNGYEAAKKLQSSEKYRSIPFIFLTVRDDMESEIQGLLLGAADYIHKPFVAPLLFQRIKMNLTLMDYKKAEIISVATVTAMKHIREGFVLVDLNNNYLASNSAMTKMLPDITRLEKGDSIFLLKGWPEELNSIDNGSVEFSITDESTRYFRAGISPVFIENDIFIAKIFLFTDITENINFLTELEKATYIDTLTGVYNRKHFIELADADIKRAVRMKQFIYIVMLDIDLFRNINETYGHTAGDMVLKTAAGILQHALRSYDLVGRYGGEKFILLIAVTGESDAEIVAERILKDMELYPTNYEGEDIRITCSIGMAMLLKADTLTTAIKKAEEALCIAKNSGRNKVKTYDTMLYEK